MSLSMKLVNQTTGKDLDPNNSAILTFFLRNSPFPVSFAAVSSFILNMYPIFHTL